MSKKNNEGFGKFLSNLIQSTNSAATNGAVAELKKKMEEKKARELQAGLESIYEQIKSRVDNIRVYRRAIKDVQTEIDKLENEANKLIAGEETEV